MSKKISVLLYVMLICTMFGFLLPFVIAHERLMGVQSDFTPVQSAPAVTEQPDTWPVLIEAIIWKESRGNTRAVGPTGDAGVLQITPVYVAECNAIVGTKGHYRLEHRFDRDKSIEMFNVLNAFHNPDKDVIRAIKLHNPGAPNEYKDEILTKYGELLAEKRIVLAQTALNERFGRNE